MSVLTGPGHPSDSRTGFRRTRTDCKVIRSEGAKHQPPPQRVVRTEAEGTQDGEDCEPSSTPRKGPSPSMLGQAPGRGNCAHRQSVMVPLQLAFSRELILVVAFKDLVSLERSQSQ